MCNAVAKKKKKKELQQVIYGGKSKHSVELACSNIFQRRKAHQHSDSAVFSWLFAVTSGTVDEYIHDGYNLKALDAA